MSDETADSTLKAIALLTPGGDATLSNEILVASLSEAADEGSGMINVLAQLLSGMKNVATLLLALLEQETGTTREQTLQLVAKAAEIGRDT